jgi:predicted ester cyclase
MSLKEFMDKYRWATEEAWLKGNVDAMDEVLDPDVITHRPPFPDTKGAEVVKQSQLASREAFADIRFNWDEMIGEGNTIACRWTLRAKHTGVSPLTPVPPTGKELVLQGGWFLYLKGGKIAEVFAYSDNLGLLQQLGVVPPMGQK